MRTLLWAAIAFFAYAVQAQQNPIAGEWRYDGFFYEGHRYPLPNPNLILTYKFESGGAGTLSWMRTDDPEVCESRFHYELNGDILRQRVTWLNPNNSPSCSKDPDMHLGRETETKILLDGEFLSFVMDLNGKAFFYILKNWLTCLLK